MLLGEARCPAPRHLHVGPRISARVKRAPSDPGLRVFGEQCEVIEEEQNPVKVKVKDKPGSRAMQNSSDPDATYDGHKGPGYQAQVTETCHSDNEVQLVTSVLPQTAADCDEHAVKPVLDDLEQRGHLPEELPADTSYGSDRNAVRADERGVELVAPTPTGSSRRKQVETLTVDHFVVDEETKQVTCCPAGEKPESSVHDAEKQTTRTIMPTAACSGCPYLRECPVRRVKEVYRLDFTEKERRLAARRAEESTDVFWERYARRAGIEGLFSAMKSTSGFGKLRVRGSPRVGMALYLKAAGWNICRASVSQAGRKHVKKVREAAS